MIINNENINEVPEGFKNLVKGYIDYSAETIRDRAIPGIDGMKPVHRRILYTMKKEKATSMTKSANIVGATMKLHPHGDASIYDALVKMTSSSDYLNVPFIKGKGNFGKIYDECGAAASRYTECMLSPLANEVFEDMDGVKMLPSYDDQREEPELLPVTFPSLLCNGTMGIAVGIATTIPMFNFHEVNNAVIEIIENGKIINYLKPDFPTGGEYVYNQKEIEQLNRTGMATIKLRGKWYVDGNKIIIKEIPYYTTIEKIAKVAKEISGVSNVNDNSDINGMELEITCSSKRNVEFVMNSVLRDSDLQCTKRSCIIVIYKNNPHVVGVEELLKMWIEFRKEVISKKLNKELEGLNSSIEDYEYLVKLFKDKDNTTKFMNANRSSEAEAKAFLRELFPEIKDRTMTWITGQTFKAVSNIGRREAHLNGMYTERAKVLADLKDIDSVIVRQMKELNRKYKIERKTEVTEVDYVFDKKVEKEKPTATPVVVQVDGKFIRKYRPGLVPSSAGYNCMSDDAIACIDNRGRIIRVYLDNIDYNTLGERGTYLPVYLGEEDNFDIIITDIISDHKGCYMYDDGYVGVVDYGEWCNTQKRTKVTERGIPDMTDSLIGELDLSKPYVFVMTKNNRVGIIPLEFKHKSRTARTKLIGVPNKDRIVICASITDMEALRIMSNSGDYMGRLMKLRKQDSVDSNVLHEVLSK